MVDGVNDERMADYLDEWDRPLPEPATDEERLARLEAGREACWRMSFKASSEMMAWYWIGCASQYRQQIEALRRKLQEGNNGND